MKTWTILLTVGAVASVVAIPLVTAESACTRAGLTEAMSHPAKPGSYIFFDLTQPGKVGEWIERNGSEGLQTMPCMAQSGSLKWGRDTQVPLLG